MIGFSRRPASLNAPAAQRFSNRGPHGGGVRARNRALPCLKGATASLAFFAILAQGIGSPAPQAVAQTAEVSPQELEKLQQESREREEEARRLDQEAQALAKEVEALRERLIKLTAAVQLREAGVLRSQDRLEDLLQREADLQASLQARRTALVETVAALQKLQRGPAPALLVRPDDAAAAVRSAILLSEVVPALKAEADALAAQLEELQGLKESIEDQEAELELNQENLDREQARLEQALDEKVTALKTVSEQAEAEHQVARVIGAQAANLQRIIEGLEDRARDLVPMPKPSLEDVLIAAIPRPLPKPKDNPILGKVLAQVPADRITGRGEREAVSFAQALGLVRLPVNGRLVELFGEVLDSGAKSKGLKLQTRKRAQVVAPFTGEVVAAGPYKAFGHILILEVTGGYHLVLAGMDRLYVDVGVRIAAGEPIGTMGNSVQRALWPEQPLEISTSGGGPRAASSQPGMDPVLYVEFRRSGEPFDPLPWFAAAEEKVNG